MKTRGSIEAARTIQDHLTAYPSALIKRVELLEPSPANVEWANAVLVVHLTDGNRYRMEVHPFPGNSSLPADRLAPMSETPERDFRAARYRQLHQRDEVALTARILELGYLNGPRPLEEWTKEDLVRAIMEQEEVLAKATAAAAPEDPGPCARRDCGRPRADHAGWALGHLYDD